MYCNTCKTDSGPTLFCHVCDNYLPNPATGVKAGLVRRFVAVIIDDILAYGVLFLSFRCLLPLNENTSTPLFILISCAAILLYVVAWFSALSQGMTPGKWTLGIRAIDKRNGEVPGLGRMLVREVIGKFVSGFFVGLGFFWAIWDRDSQAWHDKLAGTVVVRRDEGISAAQPSSAWPVTAYIAFLLMLVVQVSSASNLWEPDLAKRSATPSAKKSYDVTPLHEAEAASVDVTPANTALTDAANTIPADSPAPNLSNSSVGVDNDVILALRAYASAMLANDPALEAASYAPQIEKYYLATGVDNAFVEHDKQAFLDHGNRITNLRLEDVTIEEQTPVSATVRYIRDVTWENSSRSTHKLIRSLVRFQKFDDGWKIVYEQDFR